MPHPAGTLNRLAVILLALAGCTLAATASAATFLVNSTADAPDQNVTNGVCDALVNGQTVCTLRAAIMQATNSDIVALPSGTYDLTRARNAAYPDETVGDLNIHAKTVEIRGPTTGEYPVIRPGAGFDDLMFRITAGGCPGGAGICSGQLRLKRIVLDGIDSSVDGNGALSCGGGTLNLEDVRVRRFGVEYHGAGLRSSGCIIQMLRTEFSENRAGARGGALHVTSGTSAMTADTVSFIDNQAGIGGGAIYHDNYQITLHNATLAGNRAPQGAAVWSDGATLIMVNGTVSRNGGLLGQADATSAVLASVLRPANSILNDNPGSATAVDVRSRLDSDGFNIIGPVQYDQATAVVSFADSDILSSPTLNLTGPLIAPWSLTGIRTLPPGNGSAAVNAGRPVGSTGVACRPIDANGRVRDSCDIGAAELVDGVLLDMLFFDDFEPLP